MAFIAEEKIEDGFKKIVLKDDVTKTVVEVIPSCGAILHSFTVMRGNDFTNVIDHYDDAADFSENVALKGFKSCRLSPFACRVNHAQYRFGEKTYTIRKFILNGSALHGLLYDAPFQVVSKNEGEEAASVSMQYQYHGSDEGYPFYYDCIVTYRLKKDNALMISTEVINKDQGLIPIQDGWHPYFMLGGSIDELQLEFQSKEQVVFNDELIPSGELIPYQEFGSIKKIGNKKFDSCFTVNFAECQPICVLRSDEKKMQVEIHPGKNYPYLQIYTPPHRRSIAIENLSAAPDAFNNKMGLRVLSPGESAIFTTTYKVTSLI